MQITGMIDVIGALLSYMLKVNLARSTETMPHSVVEDCGLQGSFQGSYALKYP